MEPIVLKTKDEMLIAGSYARGVSTKGALLLHMMPATKESWQSLAPLLVEKGYHVLAIDLRGHGESSGGPLGYKNFSSEEHQASLHDVEAGVAFLLERGCRREDAVLIGASIGANLAICYMALHHEVRRGVPLSPGLNYRGVDAEKAIKECVPPQNFLFATSEDDTGGSEPNTSMVRGLIESLKDGVSHELIMYKNAGHGTNMFGKELPDLANAITAWLP